MNEGQNGIEHFGWSLTRPISRRTFLRGALGSGAALTSVGALASACSSGSSKGGPSPGASGGRSKELNLLTWESYQDPAWLAEFTKQTGVKVNQATVGSPAEMFSKYKSNPSAFDIAYVTAGWFDQWVGDDLLVPIDESRIPNLKYVNAQIPWRTATTVNGKLYAVMYNWGDQPMGWNTEKVPGTAHHISQYTDSDGNINDWNIYWDPQFKNQVSIFDDLSFVEPMVLFAMEVEDPYKLTSQQMDALSKKLSDLRKNINRLVASPNDQLNAFTSGDQVVGYIQLPTVIAVAQNRGVPLKMNHVMKQKMPAWCDNASITKAGAEKLDTVYEFISYELSVPWQARFIGQTLNNGTLDPELASSDEAQKAGLVKSKLDLTLIPLSQTIPDFFGKFSMAQSVEDLAKRVEIWNQFKLGL